MLSNFFISIFKEKLKFEPTSQQEEAIKKLSDFVIKKESDRVFILKGYAGTGKTTLISALVKSLNKQKNKSVLLAPTGRAAKVFSSYSKSSAYTIHKKIYRQTSSIDGFGKFIVDKNLHKNTIFIIDEASMISNSSFESSVFGSGRLLDDLLEYVYGGENCRLILVGDTAQLPPVGISISPALDKNELEAHGYQVTEIELTVVVRQSQDSGILFNATNIRELVKNKLTTGTYPKIAIEDFDDIERVSGADLIESISDSYTKDGNEQTLIVTRSNKRANRYNQGIRASILWREEEIAVGDLLMIVKNNYFWADDIKEIDFIANGDIAEIVRIKKREEMYDHNFADVTLSFPDYNNIEIDVKILLDTLDINTASLPYEENRTLFFSIQDDYANIKSKKKRYDKVRENHYFNAMQVKFAYAVTCHKAQGGQWDTVYVDQGYITEDMINTEYFRWLYTALTRASKKLYLVNFKDEFFS